MPPANRPKSGLGRGLNALFPGATDTPPLPSLEPGTTTTNEQGVMNVPTEQIRPNPQQPRQVFEQRALLDLAASIREHGIIQPLIVTRIGEDAYQIIAGERRWQAAKISGLERVPVIVKDATPQQILELALVENIQRADLNPLEEAAAYRHLIQDFKMTQEQIAMRVGKSRVAVTNTLRLLNLSDESRQALSDGDISEGHARAMLMLETPELQHQALQQIRAEKLTVRQTEDLVRRMLERSSKSPKQNTIEAIRPRSLDRETAEAERAMADSLGLRVEIQRIGTGGKLTIDFYNEEDLQKLYEILTHTIR